MYSAYATTIAYPLANCHPASGELQATGYSKRDVAAGCAGNANPYGPGNARPASDDDSYNHNGLGKPVGSTDRPTDPGRCGFSRTVSPIPG
jgi:hypothetical protein